MDGTEKYQNMVEPLNDEGDVLLYWLLVLRGMLAMTFDIVKATLCTFGLESDKTKQNHYNKRKINNGALGLSKD
jgi:hypothetical protein